MYLAKLVAPLFAFALTATTPACSVGFDGTVVAPAPTGTLTVRWLVQGQASPSACDANAADAVEIVVYDASGNQVTTVDPPCDSFAATIELPEGTYTADVTLVDRAGSSRSVTKPLDGIRVVEGTDLAIDLDFPSSSIL